MLRIILAGAVAFAALVLSLQPAGRGALVRRNVGRRWRHALGLPLSLDRRMPAERAGGQSWLVQSEPLFRPSRKTSEFPPSHASAIRSANEKKPYLLSSGFWPA
jgi:hypothetical protein